MYWTEGETLARYPMFDAAELRRARKKGLLAFYAFRSGVRYREADLEDYIGRTYRRDVTAQTPPAAPPMPDFEDEEVREPPSPDLQASLAAGFADAILKRRGAKPVAPKGKAKGR